ncbi:MAG: hypothetical protein NC432_05020 [Roseburia sp.]|nr:hypothetical protein [Roseburia sp.]MCM1098525.1 hypothetical protein [Ruminococcus flavefaciens]
MKMRRTNVLSGAIWGRTPDMGSHAVSTPSTASKRHAAPELRTVSKSRTRIWLCAALCLCLTLTGCGGQTPEPAPQPVLDGAWNEINQEQTAEVSYGAIEVCNIYNAWVAPRVRQLGFVTQGKFGEYQVSIGDTVTKGQVLATLNPAPYLETIQALEEQLEDLTYQYEYTASLNEKTIAASRIQMEKYYAQLNDKDREWQEGEWSAVCRVLGELDQSVKRLELVNSQAEETYRLEYSYLEEQLKTARKAYRQITITAPCDGTVIALYDMTDSDYTSDSMDYVAIAEKDIYCLRCEYISEGYLKNAAVVGFRNGKQYELNYDPYDEELLLQLRNSGESTYSNFLIAEPDEDISYGDMAVIKLVTSAKDHVLLIPEITIRADVGGKYVYRKTENGREKVYVTKGISNGIDAEITSGLEEGDVIYVP